MAKKNNWLMNIIYSLMGGLFIFFGVLYGVKYSFPVSLAYGVGFFIWCLLFLRVLSWLSDDPG